MNRANYIGAPEAFNLSLACRSIVSAFGPHVYLVGSSLVKRDYRDVDVRCILPDDEFDRLFPGAYPVNYTLCAAWSVMCSAISLWLSQRSGLPIDFQFQRRTEANKEFEGERQALGLFIAPGGESTP